jgi:hypothetical protein
VLSKCIHIEDPTKGTTKSKGLRPTQNYIKPTKCPAQIRVKRNTDGSISSSNSLNLPVPTHIKCNVKLTYQKYNEMFRMLKQIGSSFALLPQEDYVEAMSRVMRLVKLAQNRTKFILTPLVSNVNQLIYPELPD